MYMCKRRHGEFLPRKAYNMICNKCNKRIICNQPEGSRANRGSWVAHPKKEEEHEHATQVSIRVFNKKKAYSDGRCLAVPLLRNHARWVPPPEVIDARYAKPISHTRGCASHSRTVSPTAKFGPLLCTADNARRAGGSLCGTRIAPATLWNPAGPSVNHESMDPTALGNMLSRGD